MQAYNDFKSITPFNFIEQLENAQICNSKIRKSVLENPNLCATLSLSKEQLRKVLIKSDKDIIEDIKEDLKKIKLYRDETKEIIEEVFHKLNAENFIGAMNKARIEGRSTSQVRM
jgi:hypothetical protein